MSAVLAHRHFRPLPFWTFLMGAGLLTVAVALVSLVWIRGAEPAGFDSLTRSILLVTFAIGIGVFTIGLGIPMTTMVSRAGTAGGVSLGSHRVVLGTTLLAILVSNTPPTVYGLFTSTAQLRTLQGFLLAALSVELTLIGASYLRLIRSGQTSWRELGFDWQRVGPDIGRGLGFGVVAFVVSALIQSAMEHVGVRQTQLRELGWVRDLDLIGFALVFGVGAIGAPLAEELYFRGYVFAAYLREKGPVAAYALSGIVFAGLHLNREALFPIFVLGMMLAWIYRRTGSVIPPITAHALNNGLAFLIFYFGPALGQ